MFFFILSLDNFFYINDDGRIVWLLKWNYWSCLSTRLSPNILLPLRGKLDSYFFQL